MRAEPWDIQVERVITAETLTSPTDGAIYKAEGRFALVFMAVTNRGLSPQTFTSLDVVVTDSQGRQRGADVVVSTIAMFIYNTDFGSDVNPDATAHVVAAFDMSKQGRSYRLMRRYRDESGSIVLEIPRSPNRPTSRSEHEEANTMMEESCGRIQRKRTGPLGMRRSGWRNKKGDGNTTAGR